MLCFTEVAIKALAKKMLNSTYLHVNNTARKKDMHLLG